MRKRKLRKPVRISIYIVLIIVFGIGLNNYFQTDEGLVKGSVATEAKAEIVTGIHAEWLEEQEDVEEQILASSEGRSIEDPYVKLNPYGTSPLSALIIFETEEASQVCITVKGKTEEMDISEEFEEYKTSHEIPVLGLYADYQNTVELTVTTESGDQTTQDITIETEALPEQMGTITVEDLDEKNRKIADNELTFAVPSTKYVLGFDNEGEVRWYSTRYNSHIFKELDNGNILFLGKDNNSGDSYNRLIEMDYTGKLYHVYTISENAAIAEQDGSDTTVVHHDAVELPSGNLLLTVNDGSQYIEDTMIEINRETGEIENTIDLKTLFPEEFYKKYEAKDNGDIDWFHQNSVVYDESDDSIIISGRHQDTVMKIDYETNEIIWILADHDGWPEEYKKYLLTPEGDGFKWNAAQHAAVIMPNQDGNEETIDLLLYDNNKVITRGDEELSEKYSAASQYRINESTMEVEMVWSYGEERGEESFTAIVGSARYLAGTETYLIDFGYSSEGEISRIVETDKDGKILFEVVISDFPYGAWTYRAERFSLYPEEYTFELTKKAE